MSEVCPRCFSTMQWRHGCFQCPDCTYKAGCCEGEAQSNDEAGRSGEGRPAPGEGGRPFALFPEW